MGARTRTDTVAVVEGPPPDLDALEAQLTALRARFPGVHLDRYLQSVPVIAPDVYLAPTAVVVGRVHLAQASSVWFSCVLRGDVQRIEVGPRSNLQDGTVVHLGDEDPTLIGADVVVGHRAVLHGCTVEDACLIGMQATVLDGAVIGRGSVVGAGALVTAGTKIPPRSLVLGSPARVVRPLTDEAEAFAVALAHKYVRLQTNYRRG